MDQARQQEVGTQMKSAEQVRQAVPLGTVRYVLMGSVGLAVLAGIVICSLPELLGLRERTPQLGSGERLLHNGADAIASRHAALAVG